MEAAVAICPKVIEKRMRNLGLCFGRRSDREPQGTLSFELELRCRHTCSRSHSNLQATCPRRNTRNALLTTACFSLAADIRVTEHADPGEP